MCSDYRFFPPPLPPPSPLPGPPDLQACLFLLRLRPFGIPLPPPAPFFAPRRVVMLPYLSALLGCVESSSNVVCRHFTPLDGICQNCPSTPRFFAHLAQRLSSGLIITFPLALSVQLEYLINDSAPHSVQYHLCALSSSLCGSMACGVCKWLFCIMETAFNDWNE